MEVKRLLLSVEDCHLPPALLIDPPWVFSGLTPKSSKPNTSSKSGFTPSQPSTLTCSSYVGSLLAIISNIGKRSSTAHLLRFVSPSTINHRDCQYLHAHLQ